MKTTITCSRKENGVSISIHAEEDGKPVTDIGRTAGELTIALAFLVSHGASSPAEAHANLDAAIRAMHA